jgi:glutathionylspermidine synthase
MSAYAPFAAAVARTGVLTDPWLDGEPRFRAAPVWLGPERTAALAAAAEGVALVHDELARLAAADASILDWIGLTPWQRGMWQCSAPHWHGIARADVFWTADGPRVCELNSDTPSGEAEAVLVNELANDHLLAAGGLGGYDPNAGLAGRFTALVEAAGRRLGRTGPLAIGIVYPTEITEDLSMVAVYARWLRARGHTVVLGAPFNLGTAADGRAALFDTACDVVVRHYKTDWWGERLPIADDEAPAEHREPLVHPLLALLQAEVHGRTAVVNPFGAVLTQNKRALAFCSEHAQRFSPAAQAAIASYLPVTRRLEPVREELWTQRTRWVLKSDYGCEGAEVLVGADVDQATWEHALQHVIAARWIAQERFEAERDALGHVVNHGVFLVGGQAAGLLARVHAAGATDHHAQVAPVFVRGAAGEQPR